MFNTTIFVWKYFQHTELDFEIIGLEENWKEIQPIPIPFVLCVMNSVSKEQGQQCPLATTPLPAL